MARGENMQVGRDLDKLLAVAGSLVECRTGVRPSFEGVPGDDEERVSLWAVGGAAPAPDAAAAAELGGHDRPGRRAPGRNLDTDELADHRPVAVGASADVDRAADRRKRAPDELRGGVVVDAHRPAWAVAPGHEVERVQQAEAVGDVER